MEDNRFSGEDNLVDSGGQLVATTVVDTVVVVVGIAIVAFNLDGKGVKELIIPLIDCNADLPLILQLKSGDVSREFLVLGPQSRASHAPLVVI